MNKPDINVTPLIDVLLVLLIIFMIVSPMKPSRFETKIPQPPGDFMDLKAHPDTLVVSIAKDDSVALNNDYGYTSLNELERLTEDLQEIFRLRHSSGTAISTDENDSSVSPVKTVFVKAPRSISYGKVVTVIDAIKLSGAQPVSLQIDSLEN